MSAKALSSKIVLYGAGGHGRVVAAQMKAAGAHHICFIDQSAALGSSIDGIFVDYNQVADTPQNAAILVTIGDNLQRKALLKDVDDLPRTVASFICPLAICHTLLPIGAGTQVLSGAVLNPGSRIGTGVIINSSAVIEHDCTIGDFCHISPNATLAGGVLLGNGVWVGAGATILPSIQIAPWTIIGAGAVVTRNIEAAGTYVGVPAKRIS